MRSFNEGQSVYIIESDGIALGDYIEYSRKKGGHKVRTSTSSGDYKVVKDELLEDTYKGAKKKFLAVPFRNKHFNNSNQ